jgi:hypothetical protein
MEIQYSANVPITDIERLLVGLSQWRLPDATSNSPISVLAHTGACQSFYLDKQRKIMRRLVAMPCAGRDTSNRRLEYLTELTVFATWTMHFQIIMKERPTKRIFKVNHIFLTSILLLHVSALQERHLQEAQSILMKLCVCYVIRAE